MVSFNMFVHIFHVEIFTCTYIASFNMLFLLSSCSLLSCLFICSIADFFNLSVLGIFIINFSFLLSFILCILMFFLNMLFVLSCLIHFLAKFTLNWFLLSFKLGNPSYMSVAPRNASGTKEMLPGPKEIIPGTKIFSLVHRIHFISPMNCHLAP